MSDDSLGVGHFRHYIYGVCSGGDEFLTTTLSASSASEWAEKHSVLFRNRFTSYSIRKVDVEVGVFLPSKAP